MNLHCGFIVEVRRTDCHNPNQRDTSSILFGPVDNENAVYE